MEGDNGPVGEWDDGDMNMPAVAPLSITPPPYSGLGFEFDRVRAGSARSPHTPHGTFTSAHMRGACRLTRGTLCRAQPRPPKCLIIINADLRTLPPPPPAMVAAPKAAMPAIGVDYADPKAPDAMANMMNDIQAFASQINMSDVNKVRTRNWTRLFSLLFCVCCMSQFPRQFAYASF